MKKILFIIMFYSSFLPAMGPLRQFMSSINRIAATQNIDTAQKELAELLTNLDSNLQNLIIQDLIEKELAQPWDKKEIKDRLNKFFILYLPRIINPYRAEYLKQLDYKVVSIIEKPWKISPTFLVKLFYDGQDKEELLKALRSYKHFWSRELDLTDKQKKSIEALENEILSYRKDFRYKFLTDQLEYDHDMLRYEHELRLASHKLGPTLEPNQFNFSPINITLLQYLGLRDNGISTINRGAFNGLRLETLGLGANDLTSLEVGIFENLSELKTLNLQENKLTNLTPGVFKGLDRLESLDLSGNNLDDSLDVSVFDDLPNLRILDISENKFSNDKISEINKKLPNITIAF